MESSTLGKYCESCESALAPGASKKCARCKHSAYCGIECQKKAWPEHKIRCDQVVKWKEECASNGTASAVKANERLAARLASAINSLNATERVGNRLAAMNKILAVFFDGTQAQAQDITPESARALMASGLPPLLRHKEENRPWAVSERPGFRMCIVSDAVLFEHLCISEMRYIERWARSPARVWIKSSIGCDFSSSQVVTMDLPVL